MARTPRVRVPDIPFHITNRALGRRLAFESDEDRRFFLSLLARAVRRHSLCVYAFCVLGTHFHLFARSVVGDLAKAMQFLLSEYSRWFNAHRNRRGSLWETRYFAQPVTSARYGHNVVQYVDFNPVNAGLCGTPYEYPFGSAFHYARPSGPPWMDRGWVERYLGVGPGVAYDAVRYRTVFGGAVAAGASRLVEQRLERDSGGPDPLDDLLAADRERLLDWMLRNTGLADAIPPHLPVLDPTTVLQVVEAARTTEPDWAVRAGAVRTDAWRIALVALLRDFCVLRDARIGALLDLGRAQVHRARAAHALLLSRDPSYANRLSTLAATALAACHAPARVCGIVSDTN